MPWLHANILESRWLIHWRNFALWIIHLLSLLSQIIGDGRTFPHLSEGILISFKHSYSAQIYIFQDLFVPAFFFSLVSLILFCSNFACIMKVWLGIEPCFHTKKEDWLPFLHRHLTCEDTQHLFPMMGKSLTPPPSFLPYRRCLYPKIQTLQMYFKTQTPPSIWLNPSS